MSVYNTCNSTTVNMLLKLTIAFYQQTDANFRRVSSLTNPRHEYSLDRIGVPTTSLAGLEISNSWSLSQSQDLCILGVNCWTNGVPGLSMKYGPDLINKTWSHRAKSHSERFCGHSVVLSSSLSSREKPKRVPTKLDRQNFLNRPMRKEHTYYRNKT